MWRKLFFAGEFRDALEPARGVKIAQPAGGIFQVGLEMEDGFAVFGVALARQFAKCRATRRECGSRGGHT